MSSLLTNLKTNSNGYLYIPYSEDFNFGSGDFTIEFWVKFNSWSTAYEQSVLTKGWGAGSTGSFLIYASGSSPKRISFFASDNGSSWSIASSQTIIDNLLLNQWYYVTVTRSGSTFTTFANGIQTTSWTNGAALYNSASHGITVGNSEAGTHPVDCNIDGLRITKGICRYTSNFNPPINDTSLATDGAFKDHSRFAKRVLNNYTNTNTNIKKFGDSGASFNGSGNYLSVTDSNNLNFRSDNFTIEYWIYLNSISGTIGIMGKRATESNYAPYYMEILSSKLKLYMSTTGSSWSTPLSTSDLLINTWYHIAAVRSDSNISLYVDGSLVDSIVTSDALMVNYDPLYIGASSGSPSGAGTLNGYIDDFRITKGVARYTSSFVVPAAPAPTLGPAPTAPSSPSGLAVTERDNIFKVSLTPPTSDGRSPITAYNFQYSEDGSTWSNTSVVSDPHYDKVSLLLPMTGSNNSFNIVDDSKYNHNISIVGDTKITTTQSWFNNGSVVFDGSNDNLMIENNTAFDLRNQDWTIEGWIRPTGDWSKYNAIISKRGNGGSEGTDADWQLYLRQNNGGVSFYSASTGGQQESSTVPYINIWNHIAAVRNGRIITVYLNGISVLSFVADTLYTTNRKVYIGGWPAGNEYFYGNMNDIRITKGVARYTTNFDPRTLTQAPANRVTGLSTIGTPYAFRARSVNSVGSSEYSSSTTPIITTLGAPSNLNVIPDNDKAYLSWTAPTSNNSAIRNYSIQYSSDNGTTWTEYSHSPSITTSIVVDGLTVGTSYSFQVAAINIAGTGTYVSTVSPVLTALREDNTYNKTRLLLHLDSN